MLRHAFAMLVLFMNFIPRRNNYMIILTYTDGFSTEITMFKLVGEINVANSTVFVMCFSNQNGAKYELWKRPRYLPVKPYKKVKMGSRVKELNTPGFYQIEPLRKADEGYYKCRASVNGTTVEKEENNDPIWIS